MAAICFSLSSIAKVVVEKKIGELKYIGRAFGSFAF